MHGEAAAVWMLGTPRTLHASSRQTFLMTLTMNKTIPTL